MAMHKNEIEWILNHIENGEEVIKFKEPNDIIGVLSYFTYCKLYDHGDATDLCRKAESIIDRIAYYWDMKDPDESKD